MSVFFLADRQVHGLSGWVFWSPMGACQSQPVLLLFQWPCGSDILLGKGLRRDMVSPQVDHARFWILL